MKYRIDPPAEESGTIHAEASNSDRAGFPIDAEPEEPPRLTDEEQAELEQELLRDMAEESPTARDEGLPAPPRPPAPQGAGVQISGTLPDGLSYVPGLLMDAECVALLQELRGLDFVRAFVRGQRLKRGTVCFGFDYLPAARKVVPAPPLPASLQAVIRKALPYCPAGTEFNQCIVSRYPKGAGIGWHTDHPRFGDCIMGVSLGSVARLQFRPRTATAVSCQLLPAPGSLYIMRGPARWDFQHQVVPVKTDRFSLTFRYVPQADERGRMNQPGG